MNGVKAQIKSVKETRNMDSAYSRNHVFKFTPTASKCSALFELTNVQCKPGFEKTVAASYTAVDKNGKNVNVNA